MKTWLAAEHEQDLKEVLLRHCGSSRSSSPRLIECLPFGKCGYVPGFLSPPVGGTGVCFATYSS